jgi:hypothetical protein
LIQRLSVTPGQKTPPTRGLTVGRGPQGSKSQAWAKLPSPVRLGRGSGSPHRRIRTPAGLLSVSTPGTSAVFPDTLRRQ